MSELRTNRIVPRDGLPSGSSGGIIQVKQAVKTDTFNIDSETFTDITGLSVSITPTRSDSKIMVSYSGTGSSAQNRVGHIRLARVIGGTTTTDIFVGDQGATTSQARASSSFSQTNAYYISAFSGTFIDSPSTTSAVTYKLQLAAGDSGYAVWIGRSSDNSNEFSRSKTPSQITVMEISG
tara:strand:+ start:1108 stop:1647 length:540 start_codon:yes stop_codon:yes gene_type:complete